MCGGDPITAAIGLVTAAAGIFGGDKQQAPAPPPEPVKPPQAAQMPDEQARRNAQTAARAGAGPAGGAGGTMLTGPGGVTKDLLSLGKNTLLGE